MVNWKRFVTVSDRWRLTVRLGAYTTLALVLVAEVHRNTEIIEATALLTAVGMKTAPASRFSAEQLRLKEQLEVQLAAVRPTHRLTLNDGRAIDCQVLARTETSVEVRECFGFSGQIVASYPRAELRTMVPLPVRMFEVTLADVQLYREFPTFKFAKFPPYTFVSDESFGTMDRLCQQLLTLRRQFEEHFAPLIREPSRPRNIQVVFFGQQEQFKAYAATVAPSYINSAGFYSVERNRLALLNQFGSSRYTHLQKQLARSQRQLELSPEAETSAASETEQHFAAARTDLNRMARAITARSVNHEGAHQLFYAYEIHSSTDVEPTWLKEGLAAYCEPAELGGYHAELARRVVELRREGKLLPLATLLNYHMATGFADLPQERSEAAYAESWAIVYFLMQPQTRTQFFAFIKHYRDVDNAASAAQMRTASVERALAAGLGLDVSTLESQWQDFLRRLQ